MEIREASTEDAEALLEYLKDLRRENLYTVLRHEGLPSLQEEERFIQRKSGDEGVIFLCIEKGKVIGMLGADRKKHKQLRHSCEFGVAVFREYRRMGIGSQMISRIEGWAREKGLRRIEACVVGNNEQAVRLYEKLGYRQEGIRIGAVEVDGSYEDMIEMSKDLTVQSAGADARKRAAQQ